MEMNGSKLQHSPESPERFPKTGSRPWPASESSVAHMWESYSSAGSQTRTLPIRTTLREMLPKTKASHGDRWRDGKAGGLCLTWSGPSPIRTDHSVAMVIGRHLFHQFMSWQWATQ